MRETAQLFLRRTRKLFTGYWGFPLVLLCFVILFAVLGISGSSVGSYDGITTNTRPHLGPLPTKPRGIRSDEWLVETQMTIAQVKDGFPVVNKHVGNGEDMTVVLDVPYKDWSMLFRPQNLIFFIAPLNFAFAFKWWFLAASLAFSTYALFLKFLPKQRLSAMLLSGCVFLAPMVQWWYQSITIVPLATGLLILTLLLTLHEPMGRKRKIALLLGLAYLITTFILVIYPPFQIPVAVVVVFCYLAYLIRLWLTTKDSAQHRALLRTVGLVGLSGIVALSLVGLYLVQHSDVIKTIQHTVYPGNRQIAAGDYSVLHVAGNFLAPYDLYGPSVAHYTELKGGANESEISSFAFPVFPLLLLGYYLLFRKQQNKDHAAVGLVAGSSAILTIFLLRLFSPLGNGLYKLLGLNLVPHNRLLIGVGVACVTLIISAAKLIHDQKINLPKKILWPIFGLIIVGYCVVLRLIMSRSPGFVIYPFVAFSGIVASVAFIIFFVYGRLRLALLTFLVFSFACTSLANPLQRNLNEVTDTAFAHEIQQLVAQDPSARWSNTDATVLENYALANGAYSLSATYSYPQLGLWHQLDPGGSSQDVYNRYAHVQFAFDDQPASPTFTLLSPDTFQVRISPCSPFFRHNNIRYVYGVKRLTSSCLQPLKTFRQTNAVIYLYEYRSPA